MLKLLKVHWTPKIDTEIADRIAAVAAEAGARAAADTNLQSNIDSEAARIDAILLASTADADSFKEIVDLISSVDTENDNAFGAYVVANDSAVAAIDSAYQAADAAEEAARIAADGVLTTAISDEETRALAAEAGLVQDILDENARAIAAEAVLTAGLSAEEAARIAAVSAENAAMLAAVSAENTAMLAAVAAQNTSMFAAVATVQADVDQNESDADTMVAQANASRLAGDNALQVSLDAEAATRLADDTALANALAAEETRALAAEGVLSSDHATEVAARIAGDNGLQAALDAQIVSSNGDFQAATDDRAAIRNEMAGQMAATTASIAAIEMGAIKVAVLTEVSADMSAAATHFIVDSNVAKTFALPMMQEGSFIEVKVARGGSEITFNAAMGENLDGEDDNAILAHPGASFKVVKDWW